MRIRQDTPWKTQILSRATACLAALYLMVALILVPDVHAAPRANLLKTSALTGSPIDPESWKLIFSDEFDGTALDTSKWNTCYRWAGNAGGCTSSGNAELEWYQPANIIVNHGLILRAEKRSVNKFHYTSGMITSLNKFAFMYGYMEARIKVPSGQGLWPAFWAMPVKEVWPPELDVMEVLGHEPDTVHMTVFWPTASTPPSKDTSSWVGPDFSADFHNFGVDWEPDAITWYVDGVPRKRFTDTATIPALPMYLIANLAVGGTWPGAPDNSTKFPADLMIQYIKVWQKDPAAQVSGSRMDRGPTVTPSSPQPPSGSTTHRGKWGVRGVIQGSPTYSNLFQVAAIASHVEYVGAIWIKGSGTVTLYVKNDAWGNDTLAAASCKAFPYWRLCSLPFFNTGSNTRLTFVVQDDDAAGDVQTLYLDDAFLGRLDGPNRLANPGFEQGSDNWSRSSDVAVFNVVMNP